MVTPAASDNDFFARVRARNELVRTIRERLKGQGLNIKERDSELVISSPRQPEKGSIHITFATGEVSYRRTLWDYLGYLPGYGSGDPDELGVDTDAIIATFTRCCQHGDAH